MFLRIFILLLLSFSQLSAFDKVVIWGHKLHSHSHSYIHNAFYLAFKHLGYDTHWFNDEEEVGSFDFSNTLFLTEGQVDANLPIKDDCLYVLHNCDSTKYLELPAENYIRLQVYTKDVHAVPSIVKMDNFIYWDPEGRCLYMPWGTDLLPFQIEEMKRHASVQPLSNRVSWIGTLGNGRFGNIPQLNPFIEACAENGIQFIHEASTQISIEKNIELIQSSYMAPAIVGGWQKEVGYIPCRIFKNISYGKFGITNSREVYELFEGKVIYNADEYQLFYDAHQHMQTANLSDLHELMDIVKIKHTYLNRIESILSVLDEWEASYIRAKLGPATSPAMNESIL